MCEDVKLCLRSDRNQGRRRFANGRSSTFSHFSLRQPRKYTRQKAGLFKVPPMFHPSAPFSTNRHVVYPHVCSSKKCNTSNARDGIRLRAPSVLRSRVLIGQLCGKVTMMGGVAMHTTMSTMTPTTSAGQVSVRVCARVCLYQQVIVLRGMYSD